MEITILSRYLSLLSHDCYSFVVNKSPKNGLEAAKYVQKFEETHSFAKRQQPWRNGNSQSNNSSGQGAQSNSGRGPSYYGYRRPPSNNGEQTGSGNSGNIIKTSPQEQSGGRQANGGKVKSDKDKQDSGNKRQFTSHGCGEPGHIRPNCPNRIRRMKSPCHIVLLFKLMG